MAKSLDNDLLDKIVLAVAAQADAFEKREQSLTEKRYGAIMERSAVVLAEFTQIATFDQLLTIEKLLQQNDLNVYARVPSTLESVQEGIIDLREGEEVYAQLLHDSDAYKAHKYREKERASPDKLVPLDAMRRALRGQASRVENYRKNVMNNPKEHSFLSARISLIRRAEKLYDAIQRDLFTATEQPRGEP